jgi:uncharacterized protein
LLQGMLQGGEETLAYCQRVNQLENDADNITREVLTAVRRTFMTPFDGGDIKNLSRWTMRSTRCSRPRKR